MPYVYLGGVACETRERWGRKHGVEEGGRRVGEREGVRLGR